MALRVGTPVPSFSLPGSDGRTWTSEGLRGQRYVLTFYPKDETPGCTVQACAFRDQWEDFRGSGVLVFGVSRDGIESHASFVMSSQLPYVLLADERATLHKALDIGKTLFGGANRVSYLVDEAGIIRAVHEDNLRFESHATKMLQAAKLVASR